MKVLVACEESQAVCKAFRERGHEAYSCDLFACSGGHPEWHIKGNVLPILNSYADPTDFFITESGETHSVPKKWDLILAFPPCTYLTVTGNRWFNVERYGDAALRRAEERKKAREFFMAFINADCEKIAVENPVGTMSTAYRKPDQIIQPWWFGEPARKATCLWLKGLPKLKPTNIVEPVIVKYKNGKGTDNPWHVNTMSLPAVERARARSKTFVGVAEAMAAQWG